jgi:hypothetical protein
MQDQSYNKPYICTVLNGLPFLLRLMGAFVTWLRKCVHGMVKL